MAVVVRRGASKVVFKGGHSVIAIYKGSLGGMIFNPRTTREQNVYPLVNIVGQTYTRTIGPYNSVRFNASGFPLNSSARRTRTGDVIDYGPPEILFVDMTGPAALQETATTRAIFPGQYFEVPPGVGDVWVNARTSGHRFAAITVTPPPDEKDPYDGAFPPDGPTGALRTIPSYLYKQYEDDDDLQAFVASYNGFTQAFVDWFNRLELPVYQKHEGALLDWVAAGLYGMSRPTLYSWRRRTDGPYNTARFNEARINGTKTATRYENVAATSDDVFKRIITWHFYKGDGKQMSVAWLKRRVGRFLFCPNGGDGEFPLDQISVIVSGRNDLTITIVAGVRRVVASSRFNACGFNSRRTGRYNSIVTRLDEMDAPEMAETFLESVASGVLEMPYQFAVTARIGILGAPQ
ncbi:MAG: hypothetical protein N2444_00010 [Methylocystis sp.]|nr:hypothetical protein [Methylocystis sp.]